MTDYEYNPQSVGQVKSAYLSLLHDEETGFKVGIFSFLAACYFLPKHFKFRSRNAGFTSFFIGSLAYYSWVHQARAHYFRVAADANRLVAKDLNSLMDY